MRDTHAASREEATAWSLNGCLRASVLDRKKSGYSGDGCGARACVGTWWRGRTGLSRSWCAMPLRRPGKKQGPRGDIPETVTAHVTCNCDFKISCANEWLCPRSPPACRPVISPYDGQLCLTDKSPEIHNPDIPDKSCPGFMRDTHARGR